jgi:spore germination cell wall hydrolase CwlJ-like protein
MRFVGSKFVAMATLPLVAAAMAFPANSFAAEMPNFAQVASPLGASGLNATDEVQTAVDLAFPLDEAGATTRFAADTGEIDPELECMAKVVHHEAGNQSRRGQLAVAQIIMNRIESGRFASTICGVANQPGQFFRTASYNPDRSGEQWRSAVEVAREARDGTGADVVPGALFFRAAYSSTTNFFRSRQRVAALGDHVFYR